jgi:predicted nucleotidyltransferase
MSYFMEKVILTGCIGSHSYGTATPASDYDYMSVVIAPPNVYLGLDNWGSSGTKEEVYDDPVKGLVEHKYFELKKFIGMCLGFNPNIIPLLWLDEKFYSNITPEGQLLLQNKQIFNSKKAFVTFSGYAHSQLQKMGGTFNDLEEPNKLLKAGYGRFQTWAEKEIGFQRTLRDGKSENYTRRDLTEAELAYDEGYLNALLALRSHAKEEDKRIKDGPITGRMGAKRKALRDQYGFDTKYAGHVIRLMTMCVEFLKNPENGLQVNREKIDAHLLQDIRSGKISQEDIKHMANDLFGQAKLLFQTTSLPDEPNRTAAHNLTMDLIRMSLH